MDDERLDALQKLPALKGPALSIMMALIISRRPLQALELQSFTGYSNQAVTSGLRKLRHFRAAVNLGHGRGYTLTPFWQQMLLPLSFADHENHDHDHENHDHSSPHGSGGGGISIKPDGSPPTNHGAAGDHENHDQPVDKSAASGEITPRHAAPEITARSGSPEITEVARWLAAAGIDAGSYKWQKIVAMGHRPEYVKAHVLTLLAHQRGLPVAKSDEIGTGALIYRLVRNYGAPPMRCADCLHLVRECRCGGLSRIPEEYRDLIKR